MPQISVDGLGDIDNFVNNATKQIISLYPIELKMLMDQALCKSTKDFDQSLTLTQSSMQEIANFVGRLIEYGVDYENQLGVATPSLGIQIFDELRFTSILRQLLEDPIGLNVTLNTSAGMAFSCPMNAWVTL